MEKDLKISYSCSKNNYLNNSIYSNKNNNNKNTKENFLKYLSESKDKEKKCKKINTTFTKYNYNDFLKR
jgi:hypothetical protein